MSKRLTSKAEVNGWKAQVGDAMATAQARMRVQVGKTLRAHGLSWDSPAGSSAQLWNQSEWTNIVHDTIGSAAQDIAADIFATLQSRVNVRGAWAGSDSQRRVARLLTDAVIAGGSRVARALGPGSLTAASNPPVVHEDKLPTNADAWQAAHRELNRYAENVASHMSNSAIQVLAETAARYEPLVQNIWNCQMLDTSRDDHIDTDGQPQRAGDPFEVGGELLMFPGDPDGSDEQTANCLCWLELEGLDVEDLPPDAEAEAEAA